MDELAIAKPHSMPVAPRLTLVPKVTAEKESLNTDAPATNILTSSMASTDEVAQRLVQNVRDPHIGELAGAVLSPSGGWLVAPATWINRMITVGLLPPQVREQYGMTWSPRQDRTVARLLSLLRNTRRLVPAAIALWPDARR